SHEIHAGINKIDCKYCHIGVDKGKSAVIPSINVCMNCHYNIQEMSPGNPDYPAAEYTAEIQKIYEVAGFDPENLTYSKEPKPIKWVKVHNTPDHVYFNHAQHVQVAGLECQTCHGKVEEMKVLGQVENLSMGWCVNCHRQTEVNFSNAFYADYRELQNKLKSGEMDLVHAADIGATECQKCHY
ncbi:MAG: cytochrome c3 family protein, partial [Chitinophagales bacterium]